MKYNAEERLKAMRKKQNSEKKPEIILSTQSQSISEPNSPSQIIEVPEHSDFPKKIREKSYGKKFEFTHGNFKFLVHKIPVGFLLILKPK